MHPTVSGTIDDPTPPAAGPPLHEGEEAPPRGVAVMIKSQHQCMTARGVHKTNASMVTTSMTAQPIMVTNMRAA